MAQWSMHMNRECNNQEDRQKAIKEIKQLQMVISASKTIPTGNKLGEIF